MQQDTSTQSWNNLGDEWIRLAQEQDSTRMVFIMPYMLELMGDVSGKAILDLGCGEGGYSRELAKRGAIVTGMDCNESAIRYCVKTAEEKRLNVKYQLGNSKDLKQFEDHSFDVVLSSMMLMDCEDLDRTMKEANRVLKPSGRMYVSVLHPCFNGNYETGIGRQGTGIDREVVVKNYFEPREWEAPLNKGVTSVLWHHRTLEDYVRAFVGAGFVIEDLREPAPTDEQASVSTPIAWLQKIPLFLYWVLKRP